MRNVQPAVFLDRDGTLIEDSGYVHRVEDLAFLPGVVDALAQLKRAGCLLIVVTNQSGIARGLYDEATVERFHAAMNAALTPQAARIDAFYFCPHHPEGTLPAYRRECADRKPGIGLFERARSEHAIDVPRSYMVGDRDSDLGFAHGAGLRGILLGDTPGALADFPAAAQQILRELHAPR